MIPLYESLFKNKGANVNKKRQVPKSNIGYFANIESILSEVYGKSKYIALSDQDDFWYKNKLETMCFIIKDEKAVYANMKIVSTAGDVISDQFWNGRSNH